MNNFKLNEIKLSFNEYNTCSLSAVEMKLRLLPLKSMKTAYSIQREWAHLILSSYSDGELESLLKPSARFFVPK